VAKPEQIIPEGTFIHGTLVNYLNGNLEQGFFCGELLGNSNARTDVSGLFGTDTCMVPEGWQKSTVKEQIALGNEGYGDYMVIAEPKFNDSLRQAWQAGVAGENHYNMSFCA